MKAISAPHRKRMATRKWNKDSGKNIATNDANLDPKNRAKDFRIQVKVQMDGILSGDDDREKLSQLAMPIWILKIK